MRYRLALALAFAATVTGCGSSGPSVQGVVRAWSEELNTGNNDGAANLFAPGAEVIQGNTVLRLATHAQAVAWNASLPCSGEIVSIKTKGDFVRATFRLGDRKTSKCDGPGQEATALFQVKNGKIVLWHQTGATPVSTGPSV